MEDRLDPLDPEFLDPAGFALRNVSLKNTQRDTSVTYKFSHFVYDTVHEQRYILVPSRFDANFLKNKRSIMQLSTLGFKGDAGEHFRPKNRPRKAYRVLNLHFL